MALILKLGDGFEQEYAKAAIETEEYYNGASRRTLTFEFDPDKVNLNTLRAHCTEENLQTVELENTEMDVSETYEGYVLRLELTEKSVQADPESTEYVNVVMLKIGKRTPSEASLAKITSMLDYIALCDYPELLEEV